MNRRQFMISSGLAGLGCAWATEQKKQNISIASFSTNKNQVSIYTNAPVKPTRVFHITDTHLSLDDERGIRYQAFSARMGL